MKADDVPYYMLLFQPLGDICTGPKNCTELENKIEREITKEEYFVKNKDKESCNKFKAFFDLAIDKEVDIAITPEYSCPWKIVTELIENHKLPSYGKLWVIGCESIKPKELKEIIEDYRDEENGNNITWICEEDKLNSTMDRQFLDPLCYVFKTKKSDCSEHTVILVQFKTSNMGSIPFEKQYLLKGDIIYIIRNKESGINLFSLICSDSLNFRVDHLIRDRNINYEQLSYLVIHLQLNSDPRNINFSQYRRDCFSRKASNKNIICLNWARNTKLLDKKLNFGGSALYFKPVNPASKYRRLYDNDLIMNNNHKKGLYYANWTKYYGDIHFLNYNEYVFYLKTPKASQFMAEPQQQIELEPEMISIYYWNQKFLESLEADDGLNEQIKKLEPEWIYSTLISSELEPLNKERLIALSTGQARSKEWYDLRRSKLFHADVCEINKRITCWQDPDTDFESKRNLLNLFGELNKCIKDENNFPQNIRKLANNCSISYEVDPKNEETYNYNLYFNKEDHDSYIPPATVSFIGTKDVATANDIFTDMCKLFPQSQTAKRVVVWFVQGSFITPLFDEDNPKINGNPSVSRNSFSRGGMIEYV